MIDSNSPISPESFSGRDASMSSSASQRSNGSLRGILRRGRFSERSDTSLMRSTSSNSVTFKAEVEVKQADHYIAKMKLEEEEERCCWMPTPFKNRNEGYMAVIGIEGSDYNYNGYYS